MVRRKRAEQAGPENLATRAVDLARPQDQLYVNTIVGHSKNSSIQAWTWATEIGEVHYALGRSRKVGGYARLNAYRVNPDGTRGNIQTGGLAGDVASTLSSVYGGLRGFVERYLQLQSIPGDCWLIRLRDEQGDEIGYDWLAADELDTTALTGAGESRVRQIAPDEAVKRIVLKGASSSLQQEIKGGDFLGRVWVPAGRFVEEADSPLRALHTECEMLHLLTQSIKGRILSRFAMNGILYFPKEINQVLSAAPTAKPGEFHNDTVLNQIINAMMWAVTNPDDPKARIPIMLTGVGDMGKQIQQIMVDASIDKTDMELRAELIDRILMGLDVQPGQVKSTKDTNHWQNWYQSDDERRVNVQPHLDTMCWALTRLVLWPAMKNAGMPPGKILSTVISYDLTEANIKTNLAEDSRQARDRFLVSDEATRRYSGLGENDKPSEEEYVRMVGQKLQIPYLATFGLGVQKKIDWEQVHTASPTPGPEPDSPADEAPVGPGVGDPGSPNPSDRKTDTPRKLRPA